MSTARDDDELDRIEAQILSAMNDPTMAPSLSWSTADDLARLGIESLAGGPVQGDKSSRGYIYVASSWRNALQPSVVAALRDNGFGVYDFKNPPAGTGFAWEEVGLDHSNPLDGKPGAADLSDVDEFLSALEHPRSRAGFASDFQAMRRADAIVAVAPCGRSAHLELGWGAGAGRHTAVLLDNPCTPELMYLMVDHLAPSIESLLGWLDETLPQPNAA